MGGEYKKYVDGYLIRNKVHEMYLRKVNKLASNSNVKVWNFQ